MILSVKMATLVTANGALHVSLPGTTLLAPLPAFPNEVTSLVANIRLTMALHDLRGGTVEPGGPMEPSTHCTCGSYGAKTTPRLLSPPGYSWVSIYRTFDCPCDRNYHPCTHQCRLQVRPCFFLYLQRKSRLRQRQLGVHQVVSR